eukprot:TRINITY_DN20798_c0_g3_i1.p1 TRINITY_DN20798_c0_g3~~TRINITY_DN20798_c0_g3_i1.p1  ORF type:complete len:457 (+),score=118.61 TRINITY_DN20798_c0_g3_i1:37-1407(+)
MYSVHLDSVFFFFDFCVLLLLFFFFFLMIRRPPRSTLSSSSAASDVYKRQGQLDPSEEPEVLDQSDPYASDPDRHPGLMFHSSKPCNAELPQELMLDSWITPKELFFIRHHHPVPIMDGDKYLLSLNGKGIKQIAISLQDLKERFPKTQVVSTVQCGGNRREALNHVRKTSGISWGPGAISTAKWGGVLLRDVLMYSGLLTPSSAERLGVKHVQFEGAEGLMASIPVEKALSYYGDVLLAYEMNDESLPPEHGFPIRVVVPGHVGVRNVKWLTKITTSEEEAEGPWQRGIAYKGFAPGITSFEGVDIEKVLSVQEQPVTSVIVHPKAKETIELQPPSQLMRGESQDVDIQGFAYSGGGRGIVRVDVSADGGKTWTSADLQEGSEQDPSRAWAWTFWEASVPVQVPENAETGDTIELVCKATDASYNSQPEKPESIWNIRGLNNNSWHTIQVQVDLD